MCAYILFNLVALDQSFKMQNCYNVGKKEMDDRLTNKHIKTLSFLQEIVEENKKLKARIQELEVYT